MGIAVLGPLAIDGENGLGLRDRVVLEALVVRAEEVVDKAVLADALWGDATPISWPKMVQGCIVRLRRALPPGSIETTPYGYRLVAHEDQLDARRFERLVTRAQEHLRDADPERASYVAGEALSLWRGPPLPDLDSWEPGRAEVARLEGLHHNAEELWLEAEIAAGRGRVVVEEARLLTGAAPYRERRWALLARALYQSGRQSEALDALARARRLLRDELGLDPGAELVALEQAILRQDPDLVDSHGSPVSQVCPYRGLLPYEERDADSYFGRESDVAACLEKLRLEQVLAVVGPSGTGKSSLVRAGVAAGLRRDGTDVQVTTPGARPLDSLSGLPTRGATPVLIVDQLEEAVTLCADLEERTAYFTRLEAYDGPVVLVLRSDRLGDLSAHPAVARLLERGLYLPTPMGEENLRAAIEGPARQAGLRLEAGLVDLLVSEVEGQPSALPLLSHVLRRTWELREGATLTVEGYRATGGIRDAVSQSAERLYERLDPAGRAHLRALFLRLVVPGEDGDPVRTRVPLELVTGDAAHTQLVEDLVDARLVSTGAGDVQIAHEALARAWPRLRGWLDDDVEGQRTFRHLAAATEAWEALQRPDSELYRGVRLAGAVEWAGRGSVELTASEQAFLDASTSRAQRELQSERKANRRLRASLAGIGLLLVVALVAGLLAAGAARDSRRQANVAAVAARVADSRRLSAQALVATEPDLSLLLGIEGVRRDDSVVARSTLYSILDRTSRLRAVVREAGGKGVAVGPDGSLTTAGAGGVTTYDAVTLAKHGSSAPVAASTLVRSPDGRVIAYAYERENEAAPHAHPVQLLHPGSLLPAGQLGGTLPGTWVDGALSFSSDGRRLAAGLLSFNGGDVAGVQVWDVDRPGHPVRTLPVDGVRLRVALNRDGRILFAATRAPDALRAYDVSSGELLAQRAVGYLSERDPPLALSPDDSLVATSHRAGAAVFDARTLRLRYVLPGLDDSASALAFSPDGSRLASGFVSGTTTVWDVRKRVPLRNFRGHSQPVEDLAFSQDGRSLYTVAQDGLLLAWRVTGSDSFLPVHSYAADPVNAYLSSPSPDGRSVAYELYGGQIQFRDVRSGTLTTPRQLARESASWWGGAWSPDSKEFATSGGSREGEGSRHSLEVWEPRSGRAVFSDPDAGVDMVDYTPDGTRLVAVSEDDTVRLLDRTTRRTVGDAIDVAPWSYLGNSLGLAMSHDGRTLFLPREGGPMQAVQLGTRRTSTTPFEVSPPLTSGSPVDDRMLVADADGTWGILPARSLASEHAAWLVGPRPFTGTNDLLGLSWSADGTHVFTLGPGSVDVWDSRSLDHLGTLTVGTADQTPDVRSLPDGRLLIAHPGGDLLTWDLRPQHLIAVACRLAGRDLTRGEWHELVGMRAYRATCPEVG